MAELEYKKIDNNIIVYFESPLDISTSPLVERSLDLLMRQYEGYSFILNLSRVAYINSAGLGVIILTAKKLEKHGSSLKLCNLNHVVKKVIDILDARDIIDIYEDEEDAVNSSGKGK
jgi:anti-anti-sigma factor